MNPKHISRKALIAGILAGSFLPAASQLHENISVEGKYVPDVIRIDRINTFPKALRQTLATNPIDYEQSGVAASFRPSLLTMPATGWQSNRIVSANRGYLDLGAGSFLNSTLSAGYRFVDNSSTLFGVRLQHNSTSLWKPKMSEYTSDVKQERYDESIGLYASHVFKGYGRLDGAIDYHLGYFNYYGFTGNSNYGNTRQIPAPGNVAGQQDAPTQTINDLAMRFDWRPLVTPSSTLDYHATLRARHFAYRALPLPLSAGQISEKGSRETNIGLQGGVRMPWSGGSSIGLDAVLDMVFLSGEKRVVTNDPDYPGLHESLPKVDDYGQLTLTPYYRFTRGLLDVRLGADIDLTFNAGPDGSRYSFFHVAPDVRFAVQSGQVGVFLNLLGGSELNTLARLHELDYYSMPYAVSSRPSYTPVDAEFGVNLGPFSGFSLGVWGKYRSVKNMPLGGWYQAWLDYGSEAMPDMQPELPEDAEMLYSLDSDGLDMHGFSVGTRVKYEHGDLFAISAEGSYQPQDGKKGYFNGYDRAKATAAIKVMVHPMEQLRINAGFNYRGDRAVYTRGLARLGSGGVVVDDDRASLHHLDLPDMGTLSLSASWNFTPAFSVWLQGDNLLNRREILLPMLPSQGLTVTGGLSVLF